jgi:hypothetical protein
LIKAHQVFNAFECALEDRDPQGGATVVVLTGANLCQNPQGFWWAPDSRLIFSLAESSPNENDSNLWEVKQYPQAGKPEGKPVRTTNWADFSFASPTGTADGKRLAFLQLNFQSHVYVAELEGAGARLTTPQRLTLNERNEWPTAWTADGRSVLFWSDRNGANQVFKQSIDRETAETVASEPRSLMPRLSLDGASILYLVSPPGLDNSSNVRMMRVPFNGGSPQLVFEVQRFANYACARPRTSVSSPNGARTRKHSSSARLTRCRGRHTRCLLSIFILGAFTTGCRRPMGRASLLWSTTHLRVAAGCSP